jgi:hypothetical protein
MKEMGQYSIIPSKKIASKNIFTFFFWGEYIPLSSNEKVWLQKRFELFMKAIDDIEHSYYSLVTTTFNDWINQQDYWYQLLLKDYIKDIREEAKKHRKVLTNSKKLILLRERLSEKKEKNGN